MSNDNRISAVLAPADKATILQKIGDITALLPFLVNLTPKERKSLPNVSTARAGMRETFLRHMTEHPELVPGFVDPAEVTKDLNLGSSMTDLASQFQQLAEACTDTATLANHDFYVAALAIYNNVKAAAQRGVAGADTLLSEEAVYFQHASKATPTPTPPTP